MDEVRSEAGIEAMSDGLLGDLVEVLLFHARLRSDATEERESVLLKAHRA